MLADTLRSFPKKLKSVSYIGISPCLNWPFQSARGTTIDSQQTASLDTTRRHVKLPNVSARLIWIFFPQTKSAADLTCGKHGERRQEPLWSGLRICIVKAQERSSLQWRGTMLLGTLQPATPARAEGHDDGAEPYDTRIEDQWNKWYLSRPAGRCDRRK
jgi:hypothetical protein